jgi:hypothetical protein
MSLGRCRNFFLAAIAGAAGAAAADPPTFQITALHSNLDGSVQFIVLTETAGMNYQHHFAGLTLTATGKDGVKVFTFPHDLPPVSTTGASIVLATDGLPLDFPGAPYMCCGTPHYYLPRRFLSLDGGTVEFAGVDRVTYGMLPSDDISSLLRDGTVARVALPASVCPTFYQGHCLSHPPVHIGESTLTAVEYYNAGRDHFFTTASGIEIEALDSGRTAGWQRTGLKFTVSARPLYSIYGPYDYPPPAPFAMQSVCRLYIPPEDGDSHFFSASADECAQVRAHFPRFVYEAEAAFYAALPDAVTGECPYVSGAALTPVFRLWNARADTNHRYTVHVLIRNLMVGQGYASEGYGPTGVAFCVPLRI